MSDVKYHKPTTISEAFSNPRYKGKIVVAAGGELYGTTSEAQALKILRKLSKKYPNDPPQTTIIPKGTMVMLPYFS